MSEMSRRKLLGTTAAGVFGAALVGQTAKSAASSRYPIPNLISRQNAPVEVSFYHLWGTPPGGQPATNKHPADQVIDAFNAMNTGVTVKAQTPGGYPEIAQKVQAELAAGNPPALAMIPWASINYAAEGLGVIPLEDVGGDEVAATLGVIRPDTLALAQLNGQTMGLPYALSCPVIYYNADILRLAGVDPAIMLGSWGGFAQEAPKVQAALNGNPVISISFNKDWPAQGIIQSNGGFVLDESGQPAMNSPEAIEAMDAIAALDRAGLYDRGTAQELRPSFIGGSTAVTVGSIAGLGGNRTDAAFDLQVAAFPTFGDKPRKMSTGGSFIGCFAKETEQRQAAWQFLKYVLSEPAWQIWMKTGYLNASTYDIPVLPGQEPAYAQLQEGLTRETPWPGARGAEIQTTWAGYVERIWANDISAEEGCNEAASELESLIG